MVLTHYFYLFLAITSLKFLVDIQVQGISFPLVLGATYFDSVVYEKHKCHKDVHQGYDSPCYIAGGVEFSCNHREFLRCSNGTCVCFRDYSYNSIREKCEPNHEHLVRRKREPGKALPDETCHLSGDCVEGLYCIRDKCECPSPCKYERDEGICDCGTVNLQFPTAPKVVTVVLSLLSAFIWAFWICKTKNKKRNTQDFPNESDGTFEMNPLNQPSKPELVGHDNFHVPTDPPPSYQACIDEKKDCAPFYPINSPSIADTSAWNVAPTKGTPNSNTALTSEYSVNTPISDGIHTNDIYLSSVLSPENVTLVDTSKSQELPLPYPVSSQNVSNPLPLFAEVPVTPSSDSAQGASLPYPVSQNVLTPLPPFAVAPVSSSNTTHSNTFEGTSLPDAIIPPTMPLAPSIGVLPTTSHPNTSEGAPLPYSINPVNVTSPSTGAPPSAPPYTT